MQLQLVWSFIACNAFSFVLSAKILAIFSMAGPSQYILVEPYLKTLASRGHELTVINAFPQKQKIKNFRDIPILEIHRYYDDVVKSGFSPNPLWMEYFQNVTLCVLENLEVQQLLQSDENFDLVIVEALETDALYAFAHHYKAPLIGISSFGTDPTIDELVGNTSPVSYVPLVVGSFTDHMTYWERLHNLVDVFQTHRFVHEVHLPKQVEIFKKYFPNATADLYEIRKNFSLIFVNQHFSLSFPRPYVPNMIEVGGFHINHKPSPLPTDMEAFISGAKHGVIYFAMGSNVKSKDFPPDLIAKLLKVFGSLKQRVMWKFEEPQLVGKPENLFISKWFPQPDILAHPNVKLFITHAGLLSIIEALHHGKPVIGIPIFYDQYLNIERAKYAGFGIRQDINEITVEGLTEKIERILSDPKYSRVAAEISRRYHDQPMKPLDKAIWWTEYVLRHKGANHMRVAAQDLTLVQYLSIDTLGLIFGMMLLLVFLIIFISHRVFKLLFSTKVLKKIKEN